MKVRSEVYDTYWKTAAERQEVFFKKLSGQNPPYSSDPIFRNYKFCNVFRASDRVSQFLIKNVIYSKEFSEIDTLFRVFFFRLLNKIETWQTLESEIGPVSLKNFSFSLYSKTLEKIKKENPIYGNAFILCANKAFGYGKKHENHLALLEYVFKDKIAKEILRSDSLEKLFNNLKSLPLIGNFMAYQIAIDFNYSEIFNFSENDFAIAGPGAERGIKKCFIDTEGKKSDYVISFMVENQEKEFERLGLNFRNLWGRPMQAIDCQGWFCETDKYSRVKFPELKSNRVKIKAVYKQKKDKIKYFYPPKWGINNK